MLVLTVPTPRLGLVIVSMMVLLRECDYNYVYVVIFHSERVCTVQHEPLEIQSYDQSFGSGHTAPPLHALALLLEQMALIDSGLDAHAAKSHSQRQRVAHRDTPPQTLAPTRVQLPPQPWHPQLGDLDAPHVPPCFIGGPQPLLSGQPHHLDRQFYTPIGKPQLHGVSNKFCIVACNACSMAIPTCIVINITYMVASHTSLPIAEAEVCGEGGRRGTINPAVVGCAVYVSNWFDKGTLYRSMKMIIYPP
jgi:hypothetical protein